MTLFTVLSTAKPTALSTARPGDLWIRLHRPWAKSQLPVSRTPEPLACATALQSPAAKTIGGIVQSKQRVEDQF